MCGRRFVLGLAFAMPSAASDALWSGSAPAAVAAQERPPSGSSAQLESRTSDISEAGVSRSTLAHAAAAPKNRSFPFVLGSPELTQLTMADEQPLDRSSWPWWIPVLALVSVASLVTLAIRAAGGVPTEVAKRGLDVEAPLASLQCMYCGTTDLPDASFCRSCGHSYLDGHMACSPVSLAYTFERDQLLERIKLQTRTSPAQQC
eukprot:TRINITY_DN95190_c0_g1_i1.p1 TRINITY_DN95190_c0_g1~~TRINITY_DN95190_c0_g1_i1.p1  ORF type:complete len:204 (+),score=10.87 TRINITY_DN95190_c0_g1_i1:69-680(+)